MSLLVGKSCKLFILFTNRRPQNWNMVGRRQYYSGGAFLHSALQDSVWAVDISCSRRLINVTLKANETPSRAGSIKQTTRCFVHGTIYYAAPACVTSFTLQYTRLFTQPFLSIRLSSVTIRGHNVTRRHHDLHGQCVSKIMLMDKQFAC